MNMIININIILRLKYFHCKDDLQVQIQFSSTANLSSTSRLLSLPETTHVARTTFVVVVKIK